MVVVWSWFGIVSLLLRFGFIHKIEEIIEKYHYKGILEYFLCNTIHWNNLND